MAKIQNAVDATIQGFQSLNVSTGAWIGRTLTAGTGITITNGDGTAGNPTISNSGSLTDLHVARYIVSAGGAANGANYTTIASAYAAAVAAGAPQTVFIQPGTYTENITLTPGINLTAFPCDAGAFVGSSFNSSANVTIIGKLSASYIGSAWVSGINLQTNGDYAVEVTGSNITNIFFKDCNFTATNNSLLHDTCSVSHRFYLIDCNGDLETTGIAYFNFSSASSVDFRIYQGAYANDSASTTASTNAGIGTISIVNSIFINNITTSNLSGIYMISSQIDGELIIGGSGFNVIQLCSFNTATSSCISVSSAVTVTQCSFLSSNTNVLTGSGTLNYAFIAFIGSSSGTNVTTQTALPTLI